MEESTHSDHDQIIKKEAPQLAALLKEMNEGLETVGSKVQALTAKVKADNFQTADGISYLDAKYLLLLSYCQSLVYYLVRKAKGLSVEKHPVVRHLVEIRLFLEKVRPIDKKLEYQIGKLTRDFGHAREQVGPKEKESEESQKSEDPLTFRPNPDRLISKFDATSVDGVYRPPKIAPMMMGEDRTSKKERDALRRGREILQKSSQGYMKEMIDDLEGKPEEVKEKIESDSREFQRYQREWEERAQQEENNFMRVPLTKMDKRKQKYLEKSSNGLHGLTDSFFDEIKTLPLGDDIGERADFVTGNRVMGKLKKRKTRH